MIASTPCCVISERHRAHVPGIAHDQRDRLRDRPAKAGGEVVDHDHALARIDERVDHVAADIAGAAGDEDGHGSGRLEWLMAVGLQLRR